MTEILLAFTLMMTVLIVSNHSLLDLFQRASRGHDPGGGGLFARNTAGSEKAFMWGR
ncbi:MAG: hypothetical protein HC921_10740 [Synechococcaceae cyanobacterium SM2_3_1]|nr:hypothetical protein [Synechococcaceae cyanobacterium SM2_3_1]